MTTKQDDPQFRDLCSWYSGDPCPHDVQRPKGIRWPLVLVLGACLVATILLCLREAWAEPVPVRIWPRDPPMLDLAGYRLFYGTSASEMTQVKDIPATSKWEPTLTTLDLAPGTWFLSASLRDTSGRISDPTSTLSLPIAGEPPPQSALVVIAPEVYNTGTFDPAVSWLVKRNKLYGTVPLGTLCDETKPAKDGYYRVPAAAVRWANPLAKTPYPLARCARAS